jgi:hypothetical protein
MCSPATAILVVPRLEKPLPDPHQHLGRRRRHLLPMPGEASSAPLQAVATPPSPPMTGLRGTRKKGRRGEEDRRAAAARGEEEDGSRRGGSGAQDRSRGRGGWDASDWVATSLGCRVGPEGGHGEEPTDSAAGLA